MILLDTNVLLWIYLDDPQLGRTSRRLISSASRVCYSSASISEIAIKHLLGRITLPGGDGFPEIFNAAGIDELPFTSRHARALLDEPILARHDPFDRFLVAQATVEGLDLLTSDSTLLALGKAWIHNARL